MLSFLTTVLTLALSADGFLIPPEVSDTAWGNSLSTTAHSDPSTQRQVISLDCPSCPFASKGKQSNSITWIHGIRNSLRMEFAVDDKQLLLNGVPFFPPNFDVKHPPLISVKQELQTDSSMRGSTPFDEALPLSTRIELKGSQVISADDGDLKVHKIDLEPLGISNKVIRVPTVQIVLAEINEKFYLLPVKTTPYESTLASDACGTIFCRVRASIVAKLAALKAAATSRLGSIRGGCLRKPGPMVKGGIPKYIGKFPSKHGHHNLHGFGRGGRFHHHGHHHRHGVARMIFNFIRAVVVPIIVGIIVGVAVGGIGLLVGQVVVFIWMRFRGLDSHAYNKVQQDEESENADCPPKYEEVYEEEGENAVDEKRA